MRLSVTRGANALEIESSAFFDPAGHAGFRWTTPDEVSLLFGHLSWHTGPQHYFDPAAYDVVQEAIEFYALFGPAPPGPDALLAHGVSHGMLREAGGQFLSAYVYGAAAGGRFHRVGVSFVASAEAAPLEGWNATLRDPRMGAWLVRSIPEPGTAWLCGVAGMLLVARMRLLQQFWS